MASPRISTNIRGHMSAVLPDTDSSEGSNHGIVELEYEEPKDAKLPAPSNSGHTDSEPSHHPGGLGPAAIEGVPLGLPPSAGFHEHNKLNRDPDATAPAKLKPGVPLDRQPIADAFGIAYKPHGSSKEQRYDLPTGPEFPDEDEFEEEMSPEFRVVAGLSKADGLNSMAASGIVESSNSETPHPCPHDIDDFFDENSAATIRAQSSHGAPTVNTQTSASSTSERGDETPSNPDSWDEKGTPSIIRVHNADALRQLTDEYSESRSVTQDVGNAPLSRHSVQSTGDKEETSGKSNDAGSVVHVGGDVRRCPVTEEEETEEEELDHVDGREEITKTEVEEVGGKGQDEQDRCAQVAKEWETIDQLRMAESSVPMEKGVGGALQPVSIDEANRPVTTEDVLEYFRSQDLDLYKASIVPFEPRRSGLFRRAPVLKFTRSEQLRDEVFLIAQIHYTPDDVIHRRLLRTIYRRLTKEKRACPDLGSHWDTIGFQGNDPCSDLNRSMGVFSLLQVLHLLETQPAFVEVLYRESTADVTGWPFLCVSIGFTKEAIGILRRGACYAECNRLKHVMEVVHELHHAQFHAFLALCRKEPATHHAFHLAKVRGLMEADSRAPVKAYRCYLSEEKARLAAGVIGKTGTGTGHELVDFGSGENGSVERLRASSGRQRCYKADEPTDV